MMDESYLRFSEAQVRPHFAQVMKHGEATDTSDRQVEYFKKSIRNYEEYVAAKNPDRKGKPISELKTPCQMERDERFWTASCLMTVFQSQKVKWRCQTYTFDKTVKSVSLTLFLAISDKRRQTSKTEIKEYVRNS